MSGSPRPWVLYSSNYYYYFFSFFSFFFFTHKHTYSPFWKEQRHIRTLVLCSCHPIFQRHFKQSTPSPEWSIFSISVFAGHKTSIVVSDFIRESRMTSGAYKWGLIIHTHTHTHTHTRDHAQTGVQNAYKRPHIFHLLRHTSAPSCTHKCTFTPKSNPFLKGKAGGRGAERGVERGSLANVHNEKCKLCHFLQIKVFWWEPETIAAH